MGIQRPKWFEFIRVRERRLLGTKIPPDFVISFGPTNIVKAHPTAEKAERQVESICAWMLNHMRHEVSDHLSRIAELEGALKMALTAKDRTPKRKVLMAESERELREAAMMKFLTSTCWICGDVQHGQFEDNRHICGKHRQDEIDFLSSLPDRKLTKEEKQLRAIYRRRWDKPCGNVNTPWKSALPCVRPKEHDGEHKDVTGCHWR